MSNVHPITAKKTTKKKTKRRRRRRRPAPDIDALKESSKKREAELKRRGEEYERGDPLIALGLLDCPENDLDRLAGRFQWWEWGAKLRHWIRRRAR